MNNIVRFILPRRKMWRPPRTISATYDRVNVSRQQALIMRAGLARDPAQAEQVYRRLRREHGPRVWDYVEYHLMRRRSESVGKRAVKLLRRLLGEGEPRKTIYRRRPEAVVKTKVMLGKD
ncbi:MAG: hypothetical protein AAF125_23560 [Chloroflexota bacterium]